MAKKDIDEGIGGIPKPAGGLSGNIFSTQQADELFPVRKRTRAKKSDVIDRKILPRHFKVLQLQTASILLPVLEHYKIEALRQRKTLQCLLSEILFETAIERKLITKNDLES